MKKRHISVLTTFAGILFSLPAFGGGVRNVRWPEVHFCAAPIAVDGKLDEWRAIDAVSVSAVDASLSDARDPAVARLHRSPSKVGAQMCYDSDALYAAVHFEAGRAPTNDASEDPLNAGVWFEHGDGIELHVETDQSCAVASCPIKDGKSATVWARSGSAGWQSGGEAQISSGYAEDADGHGYTQELRIPWKFLTRDGKIPADGKIAFALDAAWKDLDVHVQQQLPVSLRPQNNFSCCVLTAPSHFGSMSAVSTPDDFGELKFQQDQPPTPIDGSAADSAVSSLDAAHAAAPPDLHSLDQWKTSFASFGVLPAFIGSRYGGKIGVEFDQDNFYIGAHVATSGPSQNVMPQSTQQGFRGGDCLQIRLNGGGKTINLCGWLDSNSNQPALTADGADLPNPFLLLAGAKEVFTPDKDGRGYVQAISIPWISLAPNHKSPAVGDVWKATFQPWWSGLDPRYTFFGSSTLTRRGALQLSYKLPQDGEVSVGIFDGTKLLQTVVKDEFRTHGDVAESWDGLDQWGEPIAAGHYRLKGIFHPRITTDYLMSFGGAGKPPWPTADGKGDWLSDEGNPQAAVTDGKWVYLAAPGCENGSAVIAVDEHGQKQWGLSVPFNPHTASLAVDGDNLFILFAGPQLNKPLARYRQGDPAAYECDKLMCLDKHSGQPAEFSKKTPQLKLPPLPFDGTTIGLWELRNQKTFTPDRYTGQPRYCQDNMAGHVSAIGLAATSGHLYVALREQNKILRLSEETGAQEDEIAIDKPAGLYARNADLFAVSGNQIQHIDLKSGRMTPVVHTGLLAPRCVTADAKGQLYVSDWASSFQVKIFSSQGKFLKAIGKEGGRAWIGKFDPAGMLLPSGVAVTDDGKLWVAEDDALPNRVSVWDVADGSLLKDYLGPPTYTGANAGLDPKDLTTAYGSGIQYKLDLAAKSATPIATIYRRTDANEIPFDERNCVFRTSYVYRGDDEFQIFQSYQFTVFLKRKGDHFVQAAAVGSVNRDRTIDGTNQVIRDDFGYRYLENYWPPFFKGHAGDNFSWVDTNGDGHVEPEEVKWWQTASRGDSLTDDEIEHGPKQVEFCTRWESGLGPDWSLYWSGFCKNATVSYRLDLKGWTDSGFPTYDIADSKSILHSPDREAQLGGFFVTPQGKLIATSGYENPHSKNAMECFDRDGKSIWAIATTKWQQQSRKNVLADAVLGEYQVPGIGGILDGWLWHGNYLTYLVADDGLLVSAVLEPGRLGPQAAWGESWMVPYQSRAGDCYLINGLNDGDHLLKLNGLSDGGRFESSVELSADDVARAAAVRALPEPPTVPRPIVAVTYSDPAPTIDGLLSDWNLKCGVPLDGAKERHATIALQRDSKTLYLAAKVHKDTPFSNKGQNWQSLFISGDCVDLMLATDLKADSNRQKAVAGDQRILFSVFNGQPIAVRYRPVVAGSHDAVHLAVASIDEIKRLDSAKVSIQHSGNDYTLEAAIPLGELGIDPNFVETLRGDVGVIFADETGSNRAERLYYYNHKASMISDLTTEATIQPGEWGIIQMPLGLNLLKDGGFESPLVHERTDGWCVTNEANGGHARIATDISRTGNQSLLLEQLKPVTLDPSLYDSADYSSFIKSANGGTGGGVAEVSQQVAVIGGHSYACRLAYRTSGLHEEQKSTGVGRGYSRCLADLAWLDSKGRAVGTVRIKDNKQDKNEWVVLTNTSNVYGVEKPYLAPNGAVAARINLAETTLSEGNLPVVEFDDVELVEVRTP